MGGTINLPGNVTPVGEFNAWADAFASAQIFSLTSPDPSSTLPPSEFREQWGERKLAPEERLKLTIFPLDVTSRHLLSSQDVKDIVDPLAAAGSPLAGWLKVFADRTFEHMKTLYTGNFDLALHDPVVIWYVLTGGKGWTVGEEVDVRVEATGQWTRGMCVVDRRPKGKVEEGGKEKDVDHGGWLHKGKGNRVRVAWEGDEKEGNFGRVMLGRIFGVEVELGETEKGKIGQ